ncbi:MAG: hypothetical protein HY078_16035 [Elusimicrobia bacterium]|nr:hypothetical protein [Elusimicrobiota bacterium]
MHPNQAAKALAAWLGLVAIPAPLFAQQDGARPDAAAAESSVGPDGARREAEIVRQHRPAGADPGMRAHSVQAAGAPSRALRNGASARTPPLVPPPASADKPSSSAASMSSWIASWWDRIKGSAHSAARWVAGIGGARSAPAAAAPTPTKARRSSSGWARVFERKYALFKRMSARRDALKNKKVSAAHP